MVQPFEREPGSTRDCDQRLVGDRDGEVPAPQSFEFWHALRAQNAQYAAGKIGTEPAPPGQAVVYTVTATGRLVEPEEFGDIVVRTGFSNAGPGGVRPLMSAY